MHGVGEMVNQEKKAVSWQYVEDFLSELLLKVFLKQGIGSRGYSRTHDDQFRDGDALKRHEVFQVD